MVVVVLVVVLAEEVVGWWWGALSTGNSSMHSVSNGTTSKRDGSVEIGSVITC